MVKALASLDHLSIGCQMSNKQLTDLFTEVSKGSMKKIELDGLIPHKGLSARFCAGPGSFFCDSCQAGQ